MNVPFTRTKPGSGWLFATGLAVVGLLVAGGCTSGSQGGAGVAGGGAHTAAPAVAQATPHAGGANASDGKASSPSPSSTNTSAPKSTLPSAADRARLKQAMKKQRPGNVNKVVPARTITTKPAVGLTSTADFGGKVTVQVVRQQAVKGSAQLPGEISGPAVKLTIDVKNGSSSAINLDSVLVDVQDAKGASAAPLLAPPAKHINGNLGSGQLASGIYLFTLPVKARGHCTIRVSYSADAPVVVFSGALK